MMATPKGNVRNGNNAHSFTESPSFSSSDDSGGSGGSGSGSEESDGDGGSEDSSLELQDRPQSHRPPPPPASTASRTSDKDRAIIERNRRLLAQRNGGDDSFGDDGMGPLSPKPTTVIVTTPDGKTRKKPSRAAKSSTVPKPHVSDLSASATTPPAEVTVPATAAPEKSSGLFGRDADRDALLRAYEARHRRHLVLLVGQPGNGKSSLARALRDRVERDDGRFLTGRFDPLGRPEPFGPLRAAVREFFLETAANRGHRERIRNALTRVMDPSELRALAGILPSLRNALRDETTMTTTTASDGDGDREEHSRSSFLVTFCNLLRAIAHPDHPIVLFLDDLQAADPGSLEVLKILVADPKIQGLFCAVAFRPVGVRHPCSLLLRNLESSGVPFVPILPSPLAADAIATWMRYGTDLVRDMIVRPGDHMERVCRIIADGTRGNALAVHLCLTVMRLHGDIVRETGGTPLQGGGDVKRLFGLLYGMLSPSCQTALSVAACLGNLAIDADLLERLVGDDLERDLREAEDSGLLRYIPDDCGMTSYMDEHLGFSVKDATAAGADDDHPGVAAVSVGKRKKDKKKKKKSKRSPPTTTAAPDFIISEALKDCIVADEHVDDYYAVPASSFGLLNAENKRDLSSGKYVFVNSTYKDCIYNSLAPADRSAYHVAAGKLLLQRYEAGEADADDIYRIVSQLQQGTDQLSPRGKETLARLCLRAGQNTSDWTEFTAATRYLDLGIELLMEGSAKWKHQYDLSLALYRASADVCNCTGNFDLMDKRLLEILDYATGSADKLKAYLIQMQSLSGRTLHPDAIQLGLKVLPKLSEPISTKGSSNTLLSDTDEKAVRKLMESKGPDSILTSPLMTDRKKLGAMHILNLLIGSSFIAQGELVPVAACRMVKLTLSYGLTGASAVGFAVYGASLCAAGDMERGLSFSNMALSIVEKLDEKTYKGRVMAIYWGIQGRFQKPWKLCQEPLKVSYRLCMEGGDNEFALISPIMSILNMLVAGGPLNSVAEAMKSVYQLLYKKNQDNMMRIIRPFFQEVLNLMGATLETNPLILSGNIMNEEEELRYAQETANTKVVFCIYLCQAELAFYLHKFKRAKELIVQCKEIGPPEMIISSLDIKLTFLDVMTSIAIAWDLSRKGAGSRESKKRKKYLGMAKDAVTRLEEMAKFAPSNLLQKIYMIEAEFTALEGNIDGAMDLFQKSMNHAEQHGSMADKTLACERAGLALRNCGREDDALDYLEDCCGYYRAWGALVKVNHVKGNVIPQAIFEWDE